MGLQTWTLLIVLAFATASNAQRLIYDDKRDKTAQDTTKAAKDIADDSLFDRMLRNADAQSKQEADTTMAFVEQRMRAKLENFNVWRSPLDRPVAIPGSLAIIGCRSVMCELEALEKTLESSLGPPADEAVVKARLAEIKAKKEELEEAARRLEKAAKTSDPEVTQAYALLDTGNSLLDYSRKIEAFNGSSGQLSALNAVSAGLSQVMVLYKVVQGIWDGYEAIQADPSLLRPPREKLELDLLIVEEEHLNALTRIEARKQLEGGAALGTVTTALNLLQAAHVASSKDEVEKSLRDAARRHDRAQLRRLVGALHESAAAVAQVDASIQLAELRKSDEERRYSIKRSGIAASVYDQTIQAASQRLALYWKSGIKPSELAQLVFYITNAAAVPAIAVK